VYVHPRQVEQMFYVGGVYVQSVSFLHTAVCKYLTVARATIVRIGP